MSAVLNDRDAILQAAGTRIVNPKNADILLSQSAPAFHVTAGGTADVASITVSATLVGLEGPLSWSVQGATLTEVTDRSATVTYANMQGATAIVTASMTSSGENFAKSCVLVTIQDGQPGSTAKTVKLTPSEQVFKISKTGANSPASITLTATGQNTAGTPSFTIPAGTATLTAGSSSAQKVLTFANMTTDQVTVEVTLDGQKDRVTIYKVREGQDGQPGVDAIVGLLTNETVTLPAGSNGVVSSFSGAACTMKMYQGVTDDSANWAYAFSPASASNRLSYTTSGGTVTVTGMAAGVDSAYVDITATKTGAAAITKRFTVTKSKAGASVTGARGAGQYYVVGSAWSDVAAQAACPGGPVVNDQVTISNGTVTYTKRWDGAAWNVPGAYLDGDLFVERSINGSKLKVGTVEVTTPAGVPVVTISGLQPGFEAPDTKNSEADFQPYQSWDFTSSLEGWAVSGGSATLNASSITATASSSDLYMRSAVVSVPSVNTVVRAKVRRVSGSGFDGGVYFQTNTQASESTNGRVLLKSGAITTGEWAILEFDTSANANWAGTITRLRLELGSTSSDVYEVDWITVGRMAPGVASTAFETVASNAAAGKSASDAIPGINSSLAAKLDTAGNQNLQGPVTLTSSGAIVVGTVNDGVRINTGGIIGRKAGYTTFSIGADGTALFGGNLVAVTGTLGSLRLATGGAIMGGDFTGYAWPAAGKSGCYYGPEGILLGNANGGAYWQVEANGSMWSPKMTYNSGTGVLTITGAVIVNPDIQQAQLTISGVPASINGGSALPNDTAWRVYGSFTVGTNNAQGAVEIDYTINVTEGEMRISRSGNTFSVSGRGTGGANGTAGRSNSCSITIFAIDSKNRTAAARTTAFGSHGVIQ